MNAITDLLAQLLNPETLVPYVESSLDQALPAEHWAWHRCHARWGGWIHGEAPSSERAEDLRWLFYSKDQQHIDEIAGVPHPYWRQIQVGKKPHPEGFWYSLEASLDRRSLLFVFANKFNEPDARLMNKAAIVDLELLSAYGVGDEWALANVIEQVARDNAPNFFALT